MTRFGYQTGVATLLAALMLAMTGCQQRGEVHMGPNWNALSRLDAREAAFGVDGDATSPVRLGEPIRFEVVSDEPGYLWVLSVDADDALVIVYPNREASDNRVAANQARYIPAADEDWSVEAVEPVGDNLVVFLVTGIEVDLQGAIDDASADRGGEAVMEMIAEQRFWGGGTQVVEIEHR